MRALQVVRDRLHLVDDRPTKRWRRAGGDLVATLPITADGALHLGAEGHEDVWIDVAPLDAVATSASIVAGAASYTDAWPGVDLVYGADFERVEELRVVREPTTSIVHRWRLGHGVGIASFAIVDGSIEARDPDGRVRFRSDVITARDARDVELAVTVALEGDQLVAHVDSTGAQFPVVVDPAWSIVSTWGHAATNFDFTYAAGGGDLVVFVGGSNSSVTATGVATIFDPNANSWTPTTSMTTARTYACALPLAAGAVLVVGGANAAGQAIATAELYDPTSGLWKTSVMNTARDGVPCGHMGVLSDGRALVVGGLGNGLGVQASEVFDPTSGSWTPLATRSEFSGWGALVPLAGDTAMYVNGSAALSFTGGTNTFALKTAYPATGVYGQYLFGTRFGADAFFSSSPDSTTGDLYRWRTATATWDTAIVTGNFIGPLLQLDATHLLNLDFSTPTSGALFTDGSTTLAPFPGPTLGGMTDKVILALSNDRFLLVGRDSTNGNNEVQILTAAPQGATCTSGSTCTSGNCVDGVCCDTTCTGVCQACDVSGSVGTCSITPAGSPHGTRACPGTGVCAGQCGGSSALCTKASTSTTCGSPTCATGTETATSYCDGSGSCVAGKSTVCAPFACGTTTCKTTCTSAATDCAPTAYCSGGVCLPLIAKGSACTLAAACATGNCADGVCCDTACDASCEACNGTSPGTCSAVSTPAAGHPTCSGAGTCVGACDGSSHACKYPDPTTSCNAASCGSSGAQATSYCDGNGTCVAGVVTACPAGCNGIVCAPFVDAGADAADAVVDVAVDVVVEATPDVAVDVAADVAVDVAPDSGASDVAVFEASVPIDAAPPVAVGGSFKTCSKASDCSTGFCVDGVCCNSACTEPCHSCKLPATPGTCAFVDVGTDPNGSCGEPGNCSQTCGVGGACIATNGGNQCAPSTCSGPTTLSGAGYCTSAGSACGAATATFDCSPYTCAAALGACLQSCNDSSQCASGFTCDTSTSKCVVAPSSSNGGGCALNASEREAPSPRVAMALVAAATLAVGRRRRRIRRA
ncbi:MAG: hypothetical protein ACHREM_06170 [Polyangiales bacterium]